MAATAPERTRSEDSTGDPPGGALAAALAVQSWLESITWTEDAYFALPETNRIIELSDGRLVIPELPTLQHQRIVQSFFRSIDGWNNDAKRGGEAVIAPYPIRLWAGKVREPDVVFYRQEHRDRLQQRYGGPPDLVLEVLSPSTRATDLTEKLAEYAQARVAEYWIADPVALWVEIYTLANGAYRQPARVGVGRQAVSSLLPGFAVDVATLFGVSAAAAAGPA